MSEKNKTVFMGCATALITPFLKGAVDYESLGRIIEYQISEGADALVVCGTTGESATLSDDERRSIISYTVDKVAKRIPVIAGTGCNNINKAVELSRYASECGADAVMTVTPYYNKASKLGLVKSFSVIADSVKIPVMIYNVPSRTGIDVPIEVYKELAQHENICAVKEASGNIVTTEKILDSCSGLLDVYSGNDDMTVPVMSVGGKGVVSVVANILPRKMHEMCASYFEGDIERSADIQRGLLEFTDVMFSEVNPIPVKSAAALMGFCTNEMRLPLCELDLAKLTILKKVLIKYGLNIK